MRQQFLIGRVINHMPMVGNGCLLFNERVRRLLDTGAELNGLNLH
ncbi:MAG: hypothetical protein ABF608_11845 [Sporolactobacillus sp.]